MATYVTDIQLQNALQDYIKKDHIKPTVANSGGDNEYVVGEQGLIQKFNEVNYPADLKQCLEEFDNMYLGYKATHPTQDINGHALSQGLLYFNTTDKQLYVYDGINWGRTVGVPISYTPPSQKKQFEIELTAATDTVVLTEDYDPATITVFLNGVRMQSGDYQLQADNRSIKFTAPTLAVNDLVSGSWLEVDPTTSSIITEYDKIENAPDPAPNGVLAWDKSRSSFFFYSATEGGWIGKRENNSIKFYDSYDDFEDETVATLDTLYINRNKKEFYLFDGTIYKQWGVSFTTPKPTLGSEQTLYIDIANRKIEAWTGTSYEVIVNGNDPIQTKSSTGDFIYTGREQLFIDSTTNKAYTWDGNNFVELTSSGVGGVAKVADTTGVNSEDTLYYIPANGKLYYYDNGQVKRANKEIWRMANDSDLIANAIRDEDFIYLIDDTNILKKWDNGTNRFEILGTPKVLHVFAKDGDIAYVGTYPSRAEAETYMNSLGTTDAILWGNYTDSDTNTTKWAYSIDSDGKAVLLYLSEVISVNGYAISDQDQTVTGDILRVEVLTGNNITIKDGGGNTLSFTDKTSNGNISDGSGDLRLYINGIKVPSKFISLGGNELTADVSKILSNSTIYQNTFIEIAK